VARAAHLLSERPPAARLTGPSGPGPHLPRAAVAFRERPGHDGAHHPMRADRWVRAAGAFM